MIDIQIQDVVRLERAFKHIGAESGPKAVAKSLTRVAFLTRKVSQERTLHEDMTIRSKFVERSVRYKRTTGKTIGTMESEAGSVMDGLRAAEEGSTIHAKGKHGVPLPTRYASGEGRSSEKRQRVVRKRNMINRMEISASLLGAKGKNNKQTLIMKIVHAIETGEREFFHKFDTGKRKAGIFRVIGGRKRGMWKGRGIPKGVRLESVQDLSEKTVTVPAHPWLLPASEAAYLKLPHLYEQEMGAEVKRAKRFVLKR